MKDKDIARRVVDLVLTLGLGQVGIDKPWKLAFMVAQPVGLFETIADLIGDLAAFSVCR